MFNQQQEKATLESPQNDALTLPIERENTIRTVQPPAMRRYCRRSLAIAGVDTSRNTSPIYCRGMRSSAIQCGR